jgi:hypothetical protein
VSARRQTPRGVSAGSARPRRRAGQRRWDPWPAVPGARRGCDGGGGGRERKCEGLNKIGNEKRKRKSSLTQRQSPRPRCDRRPDVSRARRVLEGVSALLCAPGPRRDLRDHGAPDAAAEGVLEQPRQLGVAVRHKGAAPPPRRQRVDAVAEREQRPVDGGALALCVGPRARAGGVAAEAAAQVGAAVVTRRKREKKINEKKSQKKSKQKKKKKKSQLTAHTLTHTHTLLLLGT